MKWDVLNSRELNLWIYCIGLRSPYLLYFLLALEIEISVDLALQILNKTGCPCAILSPQNIQNKKDIVCQIRAVKETSWKNSCLYDKYLVSHLMVEFTYFRHFSSKSRQKNRPPDKKVYNGQQIRRSHTIILTMPDNHLRPDIQCCNTSDDRQEFSVTPRT